MRKLFTFLVALAAGVGMSWAETTVTWTQSDLESLGMDMFDNSSTTINGVTLTVNSGEISPDPMYGPTFLGYGGQNSFTFSTDLGNFTKIQLQTSEDGYSEKGYSEFIGWSNLNCQWTGNASSVDFGAAAYGVIQIVFTIEPAAPANPSGSCGESLTWEFDPATGALTISGTGAMTSAPWSDYKTQITSVSLPDGLTTIGTGAFQYCSALTSVEIPASVTSINMGAFQYCSALTSVELPNGLTTIGRSAFINCSALTSIEIPASVTSIGIDAFNRCISLTSVVIPNGVTFLGKMAFAYCSQLTSVEIPASVTTINERMFDSCTGLTTITNHATTPQTLGENVFRVLTLSNITLNVPYSALADYQAADVWKDFGTIAAIPGTEPEEPANPSGSCGESLTWEFDPATGALTISGTGAMTSHPWSDDYKTQITSVTLPDDLTEIGQYAFDGCNQITSIAIPNGVTSINDGAFLNCSALASVEIPNSVTTIGDDAFYGCVALTSIEIPNSVTTIGQAAFRNTGLTSVKISGGVTSIADQTYAFCTALTSVEIHENVTSIGNSAFAFSTGLTTVTNHATTPQSINEEVFFNVTLGNVTLYVPYASLADYQASDVWKDFGTISAIPGTEPEEPTAIDNININAKAVKEFRNGILYIIRPDGAIYNATGVRVK